MTKKTKEIEPFKKLFTCHQDIVHSVHIHTGGYSQTEPGHIWGPGVRSYYLLHYIIRGHGWFEVRKERHTLAAGDLFLGYPNEIIKYGADFKDPWYYCWIGFSGMDIPHVLKMTEFSHKNHTMHIDSPKIPEAIIKIYENYEANFASYLEMLSAFNHFLSLLVEASHSNYPPPNQKHKGKRGIYLEKAISFMETDNSVGCTIDDVAQYVGISTCQLYRIFMEEYSVSPSKYQAQLRIQKACNLLLDNPTMPISVIAYSVGYNDPLYFSKVFHKLIGKSPTEYRKGDIAGQ